MDLSLSPLFALVLALLQLGPVFYAMTALQGRAALNITMSICLLAVAVGSLVWSITGLSAFAMVYLGSLAVGLCGIWSYRRQALA